MFQREKTVSNWDLNGKKKKIVFKLTKVFMY